MEDKIRAWLGDAAAPFRYEVGGRARDGWRARWRPDDQATIARAAAALRGDDVRVFLGDGGTVAYALPGLPALDVIELARVGTHDDGADWRDVQAVLAAAASPFDVVFADEAGLEAVFHAAIDPARARALAEAVLDHGWLDSICMMAEEAAEEDDGGDDPLAGVIAYIVGRNALRLWWD